eukprot:2546536-Amphidinium_carterae.1
MMVLKTIVTETTTKTTSDACCNGSAVGVVVSLVFLSAEWQLWCHAEQVGRDETEKNNESVLALLKKMVGIELVITTKMIA